MWEPATGAHDGSASRGGEWLTPNVPGGGRSVSPELVASKGRTTSGEKRTVGLESQSRYWMTPSVSNSQGNEYTRDRGQPGAERRTLTGQAQQWPTPRATDGTKGGPNQAGSKGDLMLPSAAAQWSTPNAHDGRRPGADLKSTQGGNLSRDAVMWPTPASRDYRTPNSQESQESQESRKHTGGEQLPNFVEHHFSPQGLLTLDGQTSCKPPHGSPRRLNPAFGCWLMGLPCWWTNPGLTSFAKLEMAAYRSRLQWHLSSLCGALQEVEA